MLRRGSTGGEVRKARTVQRFGTARAPGGGALHPSACPAPRANPEHAGALGYSSPRGNLGPVGEMPSAVCFAL